MPGGVGPRGAVPDGVVERDRVRPPCGDRVFEPMPELVAVKRAADFPVKFQGVVSVDRLIEDLACYCPRSLMERRQLPAGMISHSGHRPTRHPTRHNRLARRA